MRKLLFYCDRCKKQIPAGATVYRLITETFVDDPMDSEYENGAELCEDCFNAVDNAILIIMQNTNIKCSAHDVCSTCEGGRE